jgi:alkylated DNA nucleotide flippase Atl1
MLLEAVENQYRLGTNQPQVPRRGYPIEHILPQRWSDHWPVAGPEAESERASHVHRLGNLTLLTTSLNSKVSNGPWIGKREALQEHDTLLLNSRLIATTQGHDWDETSIDERTGRLTEVLLDVWPVPVGHVGEVIDPQEKAQNWIQIKDLVNANLLAPGTVLTAREGQWKAHTATVTAEGLLEVDGKMFDSPSGAGKHVKGGATNGWSFWRLGDGRRLVDVRSAFTGEQPTQSVESFDWSALHAMLEALPEGSWTTYGSLADAVGTGAQAIGNHMAACKQCANPHRVLRSGGSVSSDFAWSDPDDDRDPADLLMGEGVSFTDGKAAPTRELSADELAALIGEGEQA